MHGILQRGFLYSITGNAARKKLGSEDCKVIDWPLALSTVSQAIKLAKDLRSIDKELSQAELKLKIADLTSALADLKLTLTEAKSDAAEKDAEIARLKGLQRRLADETRARRLQVPQTQRRQAGRSWRPLL